eukprot:796469-Rhodomonas_salina.1
MGSRGKRGEAEARRERERGETESRDKALGSSSETGVETERDTVDGVCQSRRTQNHTPPASANLYASFCLPHGLDIPQHFLQACTVDAHQHKDGAVLLDSDSEGSTRDHDHDAAPGAELPSITAGASEDIVEPR